MSGPGASALKLPIAGRSRQLRRGARTPKPPGARADADRCKAASGPDRVAFVCMAARVAAGFGLGYHPAWLEADANSVGDRIYLVGPSWLTVAWRCWRPGWFGRGASGYLPGFRSWAVVAYRRSLRSFRPGSGRSAHRIVGS